MSDTVYGVNNGLSKATAYVSPDKHVENPGLGMLTASNTTQNRVAFFSHFRGKGVSCKSISFLGDQSTAALTQESDAKCEGRSPQC